jgi:sirohydrochlorin cobaltochelatase
MTLDEFLQQWVASQPLFIGQVVGRFDSASNRYLLNHRADENRRNKSGLAQFDKPEAAREIAKWTADGVYRPLKGAPNLPNGWRIELKSISDFRRALDYIYPGAVASYYHFVHSRLDPVDLRVTLGRQSGMYRVASRLTNAEANNLAGRFCRSRTGCLRTILWPVDGKPPGEKLPAQKFDPEYDQSGLNQQGLPILCVEACNLFVAEARKVVKSRSA